jgi:hypothetical protein
VFAVSNSSFALVTAACAVSTLACAAATGSAGLKGDVKEGNEGKKLIILLNYFSFLSSGGANLGEVVGAEDANGIDDDGEGNHELNGGG